MKKISLLIFLLLVSCAHMKSKTHLVDVVEFYGDGGFIPGFNAANCDLFDYDGVLLDSVEIKESDKPHANAKAFFVKCMDEEGKPVWPKETVAPLCSFTGETPGCGMDTDITPSVAVQ